MENFYEFRAEERISHQYNDGWKSLDNYEPMDFDVKVVYGKEKFNDDDSRTTPLTVFTSMPVTYKQISQAMANEINSSCRCEHDCCGCFSTYVRVIKNTGKTSNKWKAILTATPNI